MPDPDDLPLYLGDHPHGAYWSAAREDAGDDEEESYDVSGTTIRFMPEDTVSVPLWDGDGLLPEDPEWLHRALGLSPELVRDLAAWGGAWNAVGRGERLTDEQYVQRFESLDDEARRLVDRLRAELPSRYEVVLRTD